MASGAGGPAESRQCLPLIAGLLLAGRFRADEGLMMMMCCETTNKNGMTESQIHYNNNS